MNEPITLKIEARAYIAWDTHGNQSYAVTEDASNCIVIAGLKKADGSRVEQFESEAYHLSAWAEANGLQADAVDICQMVTAFPFDHEAR